MFGETPCAGVVVVEVQARAKNAWMEPQDTTSTSPKFDMQIFGCLCLWAVAVSVSRVWGLSQKLNCLDFKAHAVHLQFGVSEFLLGQKQAEGAAHKHCCILDLESIGGSRPFQSDLCGGW